MPFRETLVSTDDYYRDSTLTVNDNISAGDPLPVNSGDTLNNWTKQ